MDIFKKKNWVIEMWGKLKSLLRPIFHNGFDGNTEVKEHREFNKNLSQFD